MPICRRSSFAGSPSADGPRGRISWPFSNTRRAAKRAADFADRRRQDAGWLSAEPRRISQPARALGIHTLYISPLKALAVDIARNLEAPVARDGTADHDRNAHRRYAPCEAPAPAREAARHPDHHAGTGVAAGRRSGCGPYAAPICKRVILDELAFDRHLEARRAAVAGARPASKRMRHRPAASASRPPSPIRMRCAPGWCPAGDGAWRPWCSAMPGAPPNIRILKSVERVPWVGPFLALCHSRNL